MVIRSEDWEARAAEGKCVRSRWSSVVNPDGPMSRAGQPQGWDSHKGDAWYLSPAALLGRNRSTGEDVGSGLDVLAFMCLCCV